MRNNVDYELTVTYLKRWEADHGQIPEGAAVLLRTGCDRYWSTAIVVVDPRNRCGSGAPSTIFGLVP